MDERSFLFISPHLDDVVMSCGGLLYRLIASGKTVDVVSVMTEDAPENAALSELARRTHLGWNSGDQPYAVRRSEDEAAARLFNAHFKNLGCIEAIYRTDESKRPLYSSRITNIAIHPYDWAHTEAHVREGLLGLPAAHTKNGIVFSPLGLGRHVDHQLVRRAVENLFQAEQIIYYEEFPYILTYGNKDRRILTSGSGNPRRLQPYGIRLTPAEEEIKISAALCYSSQLKWIRPTPLDYFFSVVATYVPAFEGLLKWQVVSPAARNNLVRAAIQKHTLKTGGERYWTCSNQIPDFFDPHHF
jgi:LmbE family N-acetylglucosaminyl deacetylase